jgi:multiple sugar transport system permease protein
VGELMAVTTPTSPAGTPAPPVRLLARRRRAVEDEAARGVISVMDRQRAAVRIPLRIIEGAILIVLVITGIGPVLWLAKSAVSPTQDTLREPFAIFPSGVVKWGNLAEAWSRAHIGTYLLNTAVIAVGTVVAVVVVCTTVAYVLSVLRPWWGPALQGAILITLFVPGIVVLVPLYLTIVDLPITGGSLVDSYFAIWLPAAAGAFNILVVKRFFDAIPRELIEAARIDGAGPVRVFFQLILPLSRPILGVVGLLTFMASWKDYLWPLIVIQNPDLKPISVALPQLQRNTEVSIQLAALLLAIILPILIFLVFQRQIMRGAGLGSGIKE